MRCRDRGVCFLLRRDLIHQITLGLNDLFVCGVCISLGQYKENMIVFSFKDSTSVPSLSNKVEHDRANLFVLSAVQLI